MSLASAKEFIERMKHDDSLWLTHKTIRDKNRHRSLIRQAGFDFTDEELKAALDQFIGEMIAGRKSNKYVRLG